MEQNRNRPISAKASQRSQGHLDSNSILETLESGQNSTERRLKILQVCSARNSTYGAVASMMTLATELKKGGHDVSFLTFKGRGFSEFIANSGFLPHEVSVKIKIDPLAIVQMAKVIKQQQIDVVHCHLSTSALNGALAAKLAKVPSVSTVHGMSGKLSFLPSGHLIAVSSEVRKHLVFQGINESKISIVPNGVPVSSYSGSSRAEARELLGFDSNTPIIGTTARLTPLKGINHALYAMSRVLAEVPDMHYVIMGDGEQRQQLVELAESLGIADNVHFLGYRENIQEILPALDVFLFPSLREAMGISIVEAMMARVPVVATQIGGIPEVLGSNAGILVPPADPVAMADAVLELIKNKDKANAMAEEALARAQNEYSARRMASRTLAVYDAMLSGAYCT